MALIKAIQNKTETTIRVNVDFIWKSHKFFVPL